LALRHLFRSQLERAVLLFQSRPAAQRQRDVFNNETSERASRAFILPSTSEASLIFVRVTSYFDFVPAKAPREIAEALSSW
jgi:hypothetical protein